MGSAHTDVKDIHDRCPIIVGRNQFDFLLGPAVRQSGTALIGGQIR